MEEKEQILKRPDTVTGRTYRVVTSCGNCYIVVNHIHGEGTPDFRIVEVFATIGRTGGCATALLQGLTRMVSLALRAGVPTPRIVKMLSGVGCPRPFYGNNYLGEGITSSCVDALAKVLRLEASLKDGDNASGSNSSDQVPAPL